MENPEPSLLDEINASIPASDFQAEYYPGGMTKITMTITAELAGQVKALAEQRGWPEADAYVAMLASGVGALHEARARALLAEESETAQDELDLLVKRMRQMEIEYAVMKFRAWDYLQAYQAAAMSQGALVNRADGLSLVVDRLRAENDALKEQIRKLEGENATLKAEPVPSESRIPASQVGRQPKSGMSLQRLIRRVFTSQR
jgi:hypothetical protein